MQLIYHSLLLLLSFYVLARVVEIFFIESLEHISNRLKLSSDIAGATFMAVGSSAPELFIAIFALGRVGDAQAIGAGTIVGSAIFNILVIIGAAALFKRAVLTWQPVIRDLVFYIGAIIILLFTFMDGQITFTDSLIYIGYYVLYLFSFRIWKRVFPYKADHLAEELDAESEALQESIRKKPLNLKNVVDKLLTVTFVDLKKKPGLYLVNFLISVLFLAVFSHVMVDSAVHIAQIFAVPEVIIGLTILAVGTSIPDLMSSINVAKRGKGDMAIANAVGSNIFDIAIGLGLPWFILIIWQKGSVPVATENLESSIVLLLATVLALLFLLIAKKWEIGRYAGALLIAAYIFYLLTQTRIMSFELCLNVPVRFCFGI
jgi:K+-dependent Na+/Ca+ exchanger-like protein